MAEEGLSELKERDVWDANEMTPEELEQLMKTWNQVATEQSRVMQDVWNDSSEDKLMEEEKKEIVEEEEFVEPFTEGDIISLPNQSLKPKLESLFEEENKFKDVENPGSLVDNFLNECDTVNAI